MTEAILREVGEASNPLTSSVLIGRVVARATIASGNPRRAVGHMIGEAVARGALQFDPKGWDGLYSKGPDHWYYLRRYLKASELEEAKR